MNIPPELEAIVSVNTLESLFLDAIKARRIDAAQPLLDLMAKKSSKPLEVVIEELCKVNSSGLGGRSPGQHPLNIAAENKDTETLRWLVLKGFSFSGRTHPYRIDGQGAYAIPLLSLAMATYGEAIAETLWFPKPGAVHYSEVGGPQMTLITDSMPMWTPFSVSCELGYHDLANKILRHNQISTQLDYLAAYMHRPDLLEEVAQKLTAPTLVTSHEGKELVAYMRSNIKASPQAFESLFDHLSGLTDQTLLKSFIALENKDYPPVTKETMLELIRGTLRLGQHPKSAQLLARLAHSMGATEEETHEAFYRGVQSELSAQKWHLSEERVSPIINSGLLSAREILFISADSGNLLGAGYLDYLKSQGGDLQEVERHRMDKFVQYGRADWIKQMAEAGVSIDLKKRYGDSQKTLIEIAGKNAQMKGIIKSAAAASKILEIQENAEPETAVRPRKTKLSL